MTDQQARPGHGVVVGVDGSANSRAALVFAYRDAARRVAPLRVVAAYSPPEYTQIWLETGVGVDATDRGEMTATMRGKAQAMLDEVRAELSGEPAPPAAEIVAVAGLPARTLIALSAEAELLVVGSRGHGGFASLMLGSVSLQCALHARCPVTVVHSARVREAERQEEFAFDPLMATPLL